MLEGYQRSVAAVVMCVAAGSALAQTPSDPGELSRMIDELNGLLDKGERERLLDPWFLRDLRASSIATTTRGGGDSCTTSSRGGTRDRRRRGG